MAVFILILVILVLQYVVNARYTFPEPHPFSGSYIYNPYRNIDSSKWRLANFHAHTRLYLGLTNGALNTDESLDSLYKYLGYSIISISNYQSINAFESKNKWYVPVYEHGFLYYKSHQLVLNAKKVNWQDFPFPDIKQ